MDDTDGDEYERYGGDHPDDAVPRRIEHIVVVFNTFIEGQNKHVHKQTLQIEIIIMSYGKYESTVHRKQEENLHAQ